MRLKVTLPSYKQIEVELNSRSTVKQLKAEVCAKLELEPELTKLLSNGKVLSERIRLGKIRALGQPIIVDYFWARHLIRWGTKGQSRIRSSTVLIAGAGAIGNEVAKNLAMLGVGRLIIVDRDNVELSNTSRMVFLGSGDVGRNKAEVLARRIHSKYAFVEAMAFRGELETMPLKFYLDSDVIVCGLDNVLSRMYLSQISRTYSIPMVDGGITGLEARVHVFIPPNDPCPICIFPPNQYSRLVGLRNPCDAPVEQGAVPSFATSISLVSSILSQETIKLILGLREYRQSAKWPEFTGTPLRQVLFIDLSNNRFTQMDLKKGEKCYVCGKEGTAKALVATNEISLRSLKSGFDKAVRAAINAGEASLKVFLENSDGERNLESVPQGYSRLKAGDYLRVIAEWKNGEMHESILRLI
jgi:molybdopterin/thiamine biosynthesis adenylyltransferase